MDRYRPKSLDRKKKSGLALPLASVCSAAQIMRKYPLFYGLTALGAAIGTGIIYMITTYIKAPFGLSPKLWVNVANFVSLGFSIIWNFTAYSQIVFRAPTIEAIEAAE